MFYRTKGIVNVRMFLQTLGDLGIQFLAVSRCHQFPIRRLEFEIVIIEGPMDFEVSLFNLDNRVTEQ